jgi:hypothetical protein
MDSFTIARDVTYQLGEPTTDEHDQPAYRLTSAISAGRASRPPSSSRRDTGWRWC